MKRLLFILILSCLLWVIAPTASAYTNEEECGFCKNEPDCCVEMRSTKDAFACSWPIRGYCKPDTCNQIDGNHQKCGWYWAFHDANDNDYHLGTNSSSGYGCMIGDSEATMHPRCEPTPIPTVRPTTRPTSAPFPISLPPSATLQPTQPPAVQVPSPMLPEQTATPVSTIPFIIPTSALPSQAPQAGQSLPVSLRVNTKVVLRNTIIGADKGLRAAGNIVLSVRRADMSLESYINALLLRIFATLHAVAGR